MKKIISVIMVMSALLICVSSISQGSGGPVNYLNTPVNIAFDKVNYSLSWTSHPSGQYYKQEYIQKGEQADKFTSMLMLELLASNLSVKDAAAGKIAELQRMKSGNPYVTYQTAYDAKTGEQILDFTVTANAANGKDIQVAERNIYRYTTFINEKGEKGLLLVAMSFRAYGADSKKFMENNRTGNAELVAKLKSFRIPPIAVKSGKSA